MKDVEFVKSTLQESYETEHPHEHPYPDLDQVIDLTDFDYLAGTVSAEKPNGSQSREGYDYLWFQHGNKSILTHRFIATITLGKWVPRDFDVDHINHNPSDNSPANLRIVTRRDNAGNRRKALLSEVADIGAVSRAWDARKQSIAPVIEAVPRTVENDLMESFSFSGSIPTVTFTGETKPANSGGTWHKTNLGSWHLKFD